MQRENRAAARRALATCAIECKSFNTCAARTRRPAHVVADVDAEQYKAYKDGLLAARAQGQHRRALDDERKASRRASDSDGGYLMPTPTVGRVVKKVFELSPIRQIASVQTISTEALEGLDDLDEASFGWVAEQGARTETNTPHVGKYRIEAHEMYAAPKATQKLLDDAAVDVEAWLAGKVADKFARAEAAAFITGDGIGKPRGFTTYPTAATGDARAPGARSSTSPRA
jgi:HK97 family phage major capsid protein